ASGEPPVSRGFPPSVFADLPRLLGHAVPGPAGAGDITAIFSVLIDGDDHNDPIADAVRGIVDGHIVLDRAVAAQGRYPAINIPMSVSRLTHVALSADRQAFASRLRGLVARFEESHDLRQMGGYQPGVDLELDAAVAIVPPLYAALNQSGSDPACPDAFRDVSEALKRLSTGVEPSVR
ncbi:MAG: flagellum-specific ATP synthase FliI, partial [Rhodoblastus sp.]|nr:flagellum-specific ATP synthase FliI [Rhodoblastus sp.]